MTDIDQRIREAFEATLSLKYEPSTDYGWYDAGFRAALPRWIPVGERLPEQRKKPYHVIAAQKKAHGGVYEGLCKRKFVQDWHVRVWPQNFVAWSYDPLGEIELPQPPEVD